jgi:hypothetical protein
MTKAVRKVVQIAGANGKESFAPWSLFALCDDGTIWCASWQSTGDLKSYVLTWQGVPDVPQTALDD